MQAQRFSVLFLSAVIAFVLPAFGCGSLFGNGQLDNNPANTVVNECFVFDCSSGAFGGVIEWCTDKYSAFDDCP